MEGDEEYPGYQPSEPEYSDGEVVPLQKMSKRIKKTKSKSRKKK